MHRLDASVLYVIDLFQELNLGLAVIEAENGRIALDILESPQGDSVDIILTDNVMPEVWHLPACAILLLWLLALRVWP